MTAAAGFMVAVGLFGFLCAPWRATVHMACATALALAGLAALVWGAP